MNTSRSTSTLLGPRTIAALLIAVVVYAVASLMHTSTASAATKGKFDYLLAPRTACPGQLSSRASIAVQTRAMRCLMDYSRKRAHLRRLAPSASLNASATHKAADITHCQQFSHTACGRQWDYWIGGRRGLLARWAENIAWGSNIGGLSTPRAIMHSWIYSPHHRANLLNPAYNTKGVGLFRGKFKGYAAGIWVQHFGQR